MLSELITKFQFTGTKQKAASESAWISDLEHMDNLDALKIATDKIPAPVFDLNANLQRQADVMGKALLLIDDNSHARVEAITNNFMRVARNNKALEDRVINIVYAYQRRLYLARKALVDFIVTQKLNITVEQVRLLLARTLNAAFIMTKWRYFQDQVAPVGTWQQVYELVRIVEKLALAYKTFFLYEDDEKEISIATLLVQGYMLDTLTKGSFNRKEFEITAQVLNKWIINPTIQQEYVQNEHTFLVNLNLDKGPDRARGFSVVANCRYWKTDALMNSMQTFLCDAQTNKPLQRFNLNQVATAGVLIALFKKLIPEWTAEGYIRQRRRESRSSVNKMLYIYNGFDGICKKLAPKPKSAKTFNSDIKTFELRVAMHAPVKTTTTIYKKNADTEAWLIVDESPGGLGASLGGELDDWVEPGKLIGLSSQDNSQQFMVAEIRSVKKLPNGRYRVGIEVFSTQSIAAQISHVEQDSIKEVEQGYFVDFSAMGEIDSNHFIGLYLASHHLHEQTPMMIIPKAEYKANSHYLLNIDGDEKHVVIEHPMSYRDDWVRVKVRVLT